MARDYHVGNGCHERGLRTFAGELRKHRVQKRPHLKNALCSPGISSVCLEQCLAQRWTGTKWCLCVSVPPATHLGAHMLYRRMAWVHFFLIIPGCRARQVRFRVLGWWAGAYRPRRRKGAPDQLGGGPSTGGTWGHPLRYTQATAQRSTILRLRRVPFSLLTHRIVDS